jgi:pyridoxine kinase
MAILSIQSHVTYGHVGNSAAVFALQRLGHEAWPVNTVNYATHTGHGAPVGSVTPAATIRETVDRLDALGVLGRCAAVLSGYVRDAATGEAIRDAAARVRAANPAAVWCCDPVMGDADRGLFVPEDVAGFFLNCTAEADIATPNVFEFERLTGIGITDDAALLAAGRALLAKGLREIVVTSVPGRRAGEIGAACLTRDEAWIVRAPEVALAGRPNGAGDLFAAVYLGKRLASGPGSAPAAALAHSAAAVHGVIAATRDELALVEAQEEIVRPRLALVPERLG